MRLLAAVIAGMLAAPAVVPLHGQPAQRRPAAPARRPAPPPPPKTVTEPADMTCPTPLGVGVTSKAAFCDILSSRVPAEGALIKLPPHRGDVTLSFDLHNRHTYSEEQVKAGRAYAHYTATIGVLTMDNTLVKRAAIDSEFRTAADLVDRIGGVGPGGLKAVAPTGTERVSVVIPKEEDEVSLLGEKVTVVDRVGQATTYSLPGRPIAIVSNVTIEYVPAPPPKAPPAPRRR
jgi:hypothetical protein